METPASCLLVPWHEELKVHSGNCKLKFNVTLTISPDENTSLGTRISMSSKLRAVTVQ